MPFQADIPRTVNDILRIFKSHIEALQRDFSLTYAERAVKYYRYQGNPIQFAGYEWQVQLLNDMHPRQVATKRSQVGATFVFLLKVLLFLEQYALIPFHYTGDQGQDMTRFPTVIYTLETGDKAGDFSSDRLADLLRENKFLADLLEEGEIDQVKLKKFGRAGLYLGGRHNVKAVTTIPGDMLAGDEWDRTDDKSVAEQLESRLKASPFFRAKTQRGMFLKFSTPEQADWGVSKDYDELSDQHVFLIKCSRCNHWDEMVYPESVGDWYEKGHTRKADPFYMCLKCHRELDFSEIGKWKSSDPLKIHNAEWVPMKKEYYETVTRYGEGVRGYRIPWGYSSSVHEVMRERDQNSILYFHHHTLGIPYQDKKSGLTMDVFNAAKTPGLRFGYDSNYIHVMGVDQGAYATIWRLRPNTKSETFPIGRWQVVWAEFSPDSDAFKTFITGEDGKMYPKPGRLNQLMEQFHIVLCVVDAEPSGNDANNFQLDYMKPQPKVWVNHSTQVNFDDPLLGFKWTDKEKEPSGEEIWVAKIVEDKAGALDAYFNFLNQGGLEIPEDEAELETLIQHHLNIKKTTEEKKMAHGKVKYLTHYYFVGNGDHFGQSGKMTFQAASLYHRIDYLNPTIVIASGQISGTRFRSERRA